jgi:hypothetical protein
VGGGSTGGGSTGQVDPIESFVFPWTTCSAAIPQTCCGRSGGRLVCYRNPYMQNAF